MSRSRKRSPAATAPAPARRTRQPWLAGLALLLLVAAVVATTIFWHGGPAPPQPDLAGIEPQIAAKLQSMRQDVVQNPASAAAWGRLAMNYDVHDFEQAALSCYAQAAAFDPSDVRWAYFQAILLHQQGDDRALSWFERASAIRGDYAPLLQRYGEALLQHGDVEAAGQLFRQALQVNDSLTHAHLGLARIAQLQGDFDASRRHLLAARTIDPQHRDVRGMLAEVLRRQGDVDEAEREHQAAQQLPAIKRLPDPLYQQVEQEGVSALMHRRRAEALFAQGDLEGAAREFEAALRLKPDAQSSIYVGQIFEKLAKHAEAAEQYHAAVTMQPALLDAYSHLGRVLNLLGRRDEALHWITTGLQIDPTYAVFYENLATIHADAGRTGEAIQAYQQGIERTGGHLILTARLAWLLATTADAAHRDGARALALAQHVCERNNYESPRALDVLAAAHASTGQFAEAVQHARQALALASAGTDSTLIEEIRHRLALYGRGQAYRQPRPDVLP